MPRSALVVEARDPRRIKRQPATARVVVENSAADVSDDELQRCGEAADRLWQAIKRSAAGASKP